MYQRAVRGGQSTAQQASPSPPRRGLLVTPPASDGGPFFDARALEEATIDELHAAIRAGRITCVQIVQHYIDRARAYNGVPSALVTEEAAPLLPAIGAVRAGVPLRFPTETVKASTILPDLDRYKGRPLASCSAEST
jgi:hypothetical protein